MDELPHTLHIRTVMSSTRPSEIRPEAPGASGLGAAGVSPLLVGTRDGVATLEDGLAVSYKTLGPLAPCPRPSHPLEFTQTRVHTETRTRCL